MKSSVWGGTICSKLREVVPGHVYFLDFDVYLETFCEPKILLYCYTATYRTFVIVFALTQFVTSGGFRHDLCPVHFAHG